jgi:hypothetical protein
MLAAFVVTALTDGGRHGLGDLLARVGRWWVGWRWWLAALSPVAFFAPAAASASRAKKSATRASGMRACAPLGVRR